jgi:hypothetical protein
MKVLLVHPKDSPVEGSWANGSWDLVVDFGWAGAHCYAQWSRALDCPVRCLYSFFDWEKDVGEIKQALRFGLGSLVDEEGIDWWDLLAPIHYQQLIELRVLQKLAGEIAPAPEVRITRPHRFAKALSTFLNTEITSFLPARSRPLPTQFGRYLEALQTLTRTQVLEIALDKWDTDYRLRRFISRSQTDSLRGPTVLLPSAYKNVTRVVSDYAQMLPDTKFLLVTTRQGCVTDDLPPNVACTSLASYAPIPRNGGTEREIVSLTSQLTRLWGTIASSERLSSAYLSSTFSDLPLGLRNGLRVRDAWRRVFEREPICSVLCADENNLYTRLPTLLARRRGIRTVYCAHGALDVNVLIRGICSDSYLVKGEMEKDYLVRRCEVPSERIIIGAPAGRRPSLRRDPARDQTHIVFFSEAYELYSGRTENLYLEVLPSLCSIARRHGRKVLLKLHPFESRSGRLRLVDRLLSSEDRNLLEVSNEPVSEQLFQRTWFSMTVESSVAVECALAGIPCFLCGWFDLDLHAYIKQYENYGAARILKSPEEIERIPDSLCSKALTARIQNQICQPATAGQLKVILNVTEESPTAATKGASIRSSVPARP